MPAWRKSPRQPTKSTGQHIADTDRLLVICTCGHRYGVHFLRPRNGLMCSLFGCSCPEFTATDRLSDGGEYT